MMLAKGSGTWIAVVAAMAVLMAMMLSLYPDSPLFMLNLSWLVFFALLLLFFLVFFRDPERYGPAGGLLCPADGRVMADRGDDTVRIFMNVHNCHVNRAPFEGKVTSVNHRDGGLRPAFSKDSDLNERTIIRLETEHGEVTVTQIAGTLARRIVTYVQEGQKVGRGERIGMIRLGSRVDVTVPAGFRTVVREGDRVLAGVTVLAREDPKLSSTRSRGVNGSMKRTAGRGRTRGPGKSSPGTGEGGGADAGESAAGRERDGSGDTHMDRTGGRPARRKAARRIRIAK